MQYSCSKPWNTVVEGAVRKYPNPLCTHVVGLDVVERKVDKKGVLHSHRLMKIKWGVPEFVTAVSILDSFYLVGFYLIFMPFHTLRTCVFKSIFLWFNNACVQNLQYVILICIILFLQLCFDHF